MTVEKIGALAGHDDGIIWLGLHEPSAELIGTVQAQLGLHELMIEDATQAHQRPKLDIYDNALFIVLRTAQLIGKVVQYGETHLIVGKGFVVSMRSEGLIGCRLRTPNDARQNGTIPSPLV